MKDVKKFRQAVNNHGVGCFLWAKQDFPNITNVMESINFFPPVINIPKIKQIIEECKDLAKIVKDIYPILYQKEVNKTKMRFFEETIEPINIINVSS